MNNKNFIIVSILLILCSSISFAQVRIQIVPPHTTDINGSGMGGGWKANGTNGNSNQSIQEDVFELKNGSTIRGNLESFSSGVYFVNIGGILKSIPENTISKINGQLLSSVKATVPDNMNIELISFNDNDVKYKVNGLFYPESSSNRLKLKNGKLYVIDDVNPEKTIIKNGNSKYDLLIDNSGCIKYPYRILKGYGSGIPLKIDSEGIYIIPSQERNNNYADVYFWRWGASNLDGPVAKCDNKCGRNNNSWTGTDFGNAAVGASFYLYPIIKRNGNLEIAMIKGFCPNKPGNDFENQIGKLDFYLTSQRANGLFSISECLYSYKINEDIFKLEKGYERTGNGIFDGNVKVFYGNFLNVNFKNWAIVSWQGKWQSVTKKEITDVHIDLLNEDVSLGIVKSFDFSIPNCRQSCYMTDLENDGMMDLAFFASPWSNCESMNKIQIVKLKNADGNINSKKN